MQISNGTCSVVNGSVKVVASPNVEWSDVAVALGYGNPVLFSLIGADEVCRSVTAVESPTTSASGYWELTLVSPWTDEDQDGAKYIIHTDFTLNLGLPLAAGGERQWHQLFSIMAEKIDAAFGGIGTAIPVGVKTTLRTGRTLYASGELEIPVGSELDILPGAHLEVG